MSQSQIVLDCDKTYRLGGVGRLVFLFIVILKADVISSENFDCFDCRNITLSSSTVIGLRFLPYTMIQLLEQL